MTADSTTVQTAHDSPGLAAKGQRLAAKAGRLFAWLLRLPTLRMFAEDRVLLFATLVLSVSALSPIAATPIMPLVDMGVNVGAASLLDDAAFGHGVVRELYFVNLQPMPYWTVYLLIALLEHPFGPLRAAQIVVALVVVLLPLGVMRILRASGRDPRAGLWAFLLTWDTNLYWGWITFQSGMVLALFLIAWLIELRSTRDALRALMLTVAIALTHVHAVALVLAVSGLLCLLRRPFLPTLARYAVALSGCALVLVPWLWSRLHSSPNLPPAPPFTFEFHTLGQRMGDFYRFTLDNLPGAGERLTLCAFVLLLVGPALLAMLAPRDVSPFQRIAPLAMLLASSALYLGLPFAVGGPIEHWWTYPRFGSYVLASLVLVPRPMLGRARALALLPGVALALMLHHGIAQQFTEYGAYVRPYLRIIEALPKNVRLLPLDLDDYRFRGTREAVLGQLHGYAAAVSSSYDGHLFDYPTSPLRYAEGKQLPHPEWRQPRAFTMNEHGRFYDYLIVHPADQDFVGARWPERVRLVRESGAFRLYKVLK